MLTALRIINYINMALLSLCLAYYIAEAYNGQFNAAGFFISGLGVLLSFINMKHFESREQTN